MGEEQLKRFRAEFSSSFSQRRVDDEDHVARVYDEEDGRKGGEVMKSEGEDGLSCRRQGDVCEELEERKEVPGWEERVVREKIDEWYRDEGEEGGCLSKFSVQQSFQRLRERRLTSVVA